MADDDEDSIELFKVIIELFSWKRKDEFCDKLNNKFTTLILVIFSAVVTIYQFLNAPIVCWCPAHFTDSHVNYANSYCWVKNTYYIPYENAVPKEEESRDYITYYQWTAFILLIQACLFTLPSFLWHAFNNRGVVDTDTILQLATDSGGIDKAEQIAGLIHQLVKTRGRAPAKTYNGCRRALYYIGDLLEEKVQGFIIFLFFFTKLLYIANAICQFFLLDYFLFNQFSSYGFEIMGGVAPDHDWQDAPFDAFPRVTMCDFKVRRIGNIQRYTVQCNLPLNRFNEKIYMFLWFWMALVILVSIIGLIQWLLYICLPGSNERFVSNHLHVNKDTEITHIGREDFSDFTKSFLKADGVFILRLIAHHSNRIITDEVTGELWKIFGTKSASNHV